MSTTSNTTKKNRKPRKRQWASELSRSTHSRVRRTLANELSSMRSQREEQARRELAMDVQRGKQVEEYKRTNMVSGGLVPRLRATMNSWGLNLPLSILPASTISAFTDFKSITVYHDYRLTSTRYNENPLAVPVDPNELRQIAAETRGLFYHEVGHNLFSLTIHELLTEAHLNGYVVDADMAWPVEYDETDSTIPVRWHIADRSLHTAWNVLEDQRMESAVVVDSPQIATYLTILVGRNIVSQSSGNGAAAWPLVAGRWYLPQSMRAAARTLWENEAVSLYSASDVYDVVNTYVTADNAVDMVASVFAMKSILNGLTPRQPDSHDKMTRVNPNPQSGSVTERIQRTAERTQQWADEQDSPSGQSSDESDDENTDDGSNGSGENTDESSDNESDDEGSGEGGSGESDDEGSDDEGEGDASSTSSDAPSNRSAGSGNSDNPRSSRDAVSDLRDALQDALDALQDDSTITDDVASMNEAHASDDGSLPAYKGTRANTNDDFIAAAHNIVDDIERAFTLATEDSAPHWESGQRRGVLDVMRYATRQPGDVEVFRNYADSGDPATDIAVSLFLDISISMEGTGDALGASAWAVKAACDRLGIACDVSLFNSTGHRLWGVNDYPTEVVSVDSDGGTNPSDAFHAMLSDERPNKHHLVLVMTDGAWGGGVTMAPWKTSNMHSVIFYYDQYTRSSDMQVDARMADHLKADEAYVIGDLMTIPVALENILIGLV